MRICFSERLQVFPYLLFLSSFCVCGPAELRSRQQTLSSKRWRCDKSWCHGQLGLQIHTSTYLCVCVWENVTFDFLMHSSLIHSAAYPGEEQLNRDTGPAFVSRLIFLSLSGQNVLLRSSLNVWRQRFYCTPFLLQTDQQYANSVADNLKRL